MRLFAISREDVKKELEKHAVKEKTSKMENKVNKKNISKDNTNQTKKVFNKY